MQKCVFVYIMADMLNGVKFEIRTFVTDWPVAHLHGILYAYRSLVDAHWMNP